MWCQKGFFNHIPRDGFLESFQSLFLKSPVEFDIFQIKFGTKREISDLKLSHVENSLFNKKLWHLLNLKLGGYFSRDGGGKCTTIASLNLLFKIYEDYAENWNLLHKCNLIRSYTGSIKAFYMTSIFLFNIEFLWSMAIKKICVSPLKVDLVCKRATLSTSCGVQEKNPKIVHCFGVQTCLRSQSTLWRKIKIH